MYKPSRWSLLVAVLAEVSLAVFSAVVATKVATAAVALLAGTPILALTLAIARRSGRLLVGAAFLAAAMCVASDLPPSRHLDVLIAALQGALLLVFIEAGGRALEAIPSSSGPGHPARAQAVWVIAVAGVSVALSWLLSELKPGLSGLGFFALMVGVVSAPCLLILVAQLALRAQQRRSLQTRDSRTFSA